MYFLTFAMAARILLSKVATGTGATLLSVPVPPSFAPKDKITRSGMDCPTAYAREAPHSDAMPPME